MGYRDWAPVLDANRTPDERAQLAIVEAWLSRLQQARRTRHQLVGVLRQWLAIRSRPFRRCTRCHAVQPITAFGQCRGTPDGRLSLCHDCRRRALGSRGVRRS